MVGPGVANYTRSLSRAESARYAAPPISVSRQAARGGRMGLLDAIRHQFIEVIEWTEPSDDILVYRFPVAENEIKNGAQLTVRESQAAVFIEQGKPADQF